ncbi:alpha/beta-hydrolase [Ophiobolus disseminans]|uniref:Alpha/beta-hydrolase n=1 Tax=Ophiobolus disseminans TaxID=1469910 RepID=A0A6A6ZM30_9PLEO|nr:alpha/beta-hydrolase [Ophiobolus disseminans]
MAPLDDTTAATRFDSFHVHRTFYKKIGDHQIAVGILVPKVLQPGKHPLMVKFHGGALITGDCLYPDWNAAFFIPFIHRTNSIVVLPNYRLIPEHSGADILQDLSDFWAWFHAGNVDNYLFSQHPSPSLDLDYSKVLVAGDSAGGYMALMSALTQPRDSIKAALVEYPMTNYLNVDIAPTWFGTPSPGPEVAQQHLASIIPGAVISSAIPLARNGLSYSLAAYGRYLEFFGEDPKLWPIGLIGDAEAMPPTWIIHGDADLAVDVGDSRKFVDAWEKGGVKGEVKLSVVEGGDHGFDNATKEDEEGWLKDGLVWVEKKWLE